MPTFMSHKSEDVGIYSAICLAFDGAGVQRWDPSKMSRDESLADQLRDAIRKCEVCVFIATRRSVESPWCLAELGIFWGAGKRVLLFLGEQD
jgi:TIR domain